jgi:hypothetical protein
MRMLYWSVFLATPEACQTRFLNSWGNMIDNGIQCYVNRYTAVSQRFHKMSGRGLETRHKIGLKMNLASPIQSERDGGGRRHPLRGRILSHAPAPSRFASTVSAEHPMT